MLYSLLCTTFLNIDKWKSTFYQLLISFYYDSATLDDKQIVCSKCKWKVLCGWNLCFLAIRAQHVNFQSVSSKVKSHTGGPQMPRSPQTKDSIPSKPYYITLKQRHAEKGIKSFLDLKDFSMYTQIHGHAILQFTPRLTPLTLDIIVYIRHPAISSCECDDLFQGSTSHLL